MVCAQNGSMSLEECLWGNFLLNLDQKTHRGLSQLREIIWKPNPGGEYQSTCFSFVLATSFTGSRALKMVTWFTLVPADNSSKLSHRFHMPPTTYEGSEQNNKLYWKLTFIQAKMSVFHNTSLVLSFFVITRHREIALQNTYAHLCPKV